MSQGGARPLRTLRLAVVAALFGTIALVYGSTLSFQFVWDDGIYVVRNPAIRSVREIPRYFYDVNSYALSAEDVPMWRPVRNLSYLLDFQIAGLRPAWYHAHNVLLHMVNALLVFTLLVQLGRWPRSRAQAATPQVRTAAAALGALFWALHPVQTESVAWVKARDELLYSGFFLGALLCALAGLRRGSYTAGLTAGLTACLALALLSKEMAVTFAPVLLLMWVLTQPRPAPRSIALPLGAAVILTAGFLIARHLVIGSTAQLPVRLGGSLYADILTTLKALGRYAELIVVPVRQLADYGNFPVARSALDPSVWTGAALMAGLWFVLLWIARRDSRGLLGAGLFFLVLLPVLNLVPAMQYLAERFLYLPLVAVAICVSVAGERVLTWAGNREPNAPRLQLRLAALMLLVVLAYGTASSFRVGVWENNIRLYTHIYGDGYRPQRAIGNYAAALGEEGRFDEARVLLEELRDLLRPGRGPRYGSTLQGLAVCHLALGDVEKGGEYILEAYELQPTDLDVLSTLALYYGMSRQYRKADEVYERIFELDPLNAPARRNQEALRRRAGVSDPD